jgi:phage-related protein
MKIAEFHPEAIDVIRLFPEDVRRKLGQAIFDLQNGKKLSMSLSKPMPSIGKGIEELRVKDATGAYRALYYSN